jgi:hypothetical protein
MAIKHIIVLFVETPRKFITAKLSGERKAFKKLFLKLSKLSFFLNVGTVYKFYCNDKK